MSALESIFFACKNVGACEISEASCTHKSKKHAGEKRSFAFSTQSCHPRWLAACKLFSFLLQKIYAEKIDQRIELNFLRMQPSYAEIFPVVASFRKCSECGGLGKILKFFKGNLGMSAFCSCILSYNFLTLFELSRSGQGLTIQIYIFVDGNNSTKDRCQLRVLPRFKRTFQKHPVQTENTKALVSMSTCEQLQR